MARKGLAVFIGSAAAAIAAFLWINRSRRTNHVADLNLTTTDLDYQDLSPDDLNSAHLIDLNEASAADFVPLNLAPESLDRLIENRPYRSKLELVSRMVLTEAEYETLRDKVAVTEGREPIKIAS